MTEPTPRTGIEISVDEDAPPMTIRVFRGGRLVHEFHEAEALPSNSPEPKGEVGT